MDKYETPPGDGSAHESSVPFLETELDQRNPGDEATTTLSDEKASLRDNNAVGSKDDADKIVDRFEVDDTSGRDIERCSSNTDAGTSDRNTPPEREQWTRGIEFLLTLLGHSIGLGNLLCFPYLFVRNEREQWTRGVDFLLTLLGYSIGLGNLWRFPYLCVRNGGGSFVIPFVICVVLMGLPMVFLESCLGQFTAQNNVRALNSICPLFKGLGVAMLIPTVVVVIYQTSIMAWILYFLASSFRTLLPWDSCDQDWNTENCFKPLSENVTDLLINATHGRNVTNSGLQTAAEQFWRLHVLDLSSGLEDVGSFNTHLVIAMAASWVILFGCIVGGVHTVGKIVYVTVLFPYVLLIIFFVKGLTLEGAMDGIRFYVTPDLAKLLEIRVWVEAAVQVFFSLGQGWGAVICMASFNKFNHNCYRDAMLVCFIGEGTSVFCGLVVFTILGFVAHEMQVPVAQVVDSGPGLGFIVYPQALSKLPVPQLWSVLLFLMLLTIALDSQFGLLENILTVITDISPRLHRRRHLLRALGCAIGFLLALPLTTQGGMFIFQLMDWYIAAVFVPVICALECVVVAWLYGAERFSRDVELMLGRGVPVFMRLCWCIFTPVLYLISFLFICAYFKPPSYGGYNYPVGGQVFGWIIACLPIVPIVVAAGLELRKHRHKPLAKMLADSINPSGDWLPASEEHRKSYKYGTGTSDGINFGQRFRANILGRN